MTTRLRNLWKLYRRFGAGAVLRRFSDRYARATSGRQVVEVVWLEASSLKLSLEHDEKFQFRFLDTHEIAAFAQDPANDLDVEMVERAAGGLDLCFAALCDDRLAAYGWYALDAIEAEHNFGVAMSYPSTVAYMYKGFTHPDFRGARLHGLGMGLALKNLKQFGVSALISTVGWTNEASLRSCDRLGYERLGRIVTTGGDAFRLQSVPSAAVQRGVQFGPDAKARRDRATAAVAASTDADEPVTAEAAVGADAAVEA